MKNALRLFGLAVLAPTVQAGTVTGGLVTISTSQGWTLLNDTSACMSMPDVFSNGGVLDDLLYLAADACAIRETTSNYAVGEVEALYQQAATNPASMEGSVSAIADSYTDFRWDGCPGAGQVLATADTVATGFLPGAPGFYFANAGIKAEMTITMGVDESNPSAPSVTSTSTAEITKKIIEGSPPQVALNRLVLKQGPTIGTGPVPFALDTFFCRRTAKVEGSADLDFGDHLQVEDGTAFVLTICTANINLGENPNVCP